jgi:hypothetical protein
MCTNYREPGEFLINRVRGAEYIVSSRRKRRFPITTSDV